MKLINNTYGSCKLIQIVVILNLAIFLVVSSCVNSKKEDESLKNNKSIIINKNKFIKDSIWFKAYRHYNNEIIRPELISVLQKISKSENIQISSLGLFNMLIQNYNCENFKVEDFLDKYPFAKPEFIEENIDGLVKINLFIKEDQTYKLSKKGRFILSSTKHELSSISNQINDSIVEIFKAISKKALKSDFKGINNSLKHRINASLRLENSNNIFSQFMTAFDDAVALRNDQSHYRYQFIKEVNPSIIETLSHPEKEVLASTSYYGNFEVNRFEQRSTWGYSLIETRNFADNLVSKKLLQKNDSLYELSNLGKNLETLASKELEKRFYQPWLFMNSEEYIIIKNETNEI